MTCHKISGLTALALTFMFAACGNESGADATTSPTKSEVDTSFELGKCTSELEGVSIRVRQENAYYVCINEKWTFAGETFVESSTSNFNGEAESQFSSSSTLDLNSSTTQNSKNVLDSFTDSRDMQTYKTVTIGSQTWMARDLNYETDNSYCHDEHYNDCDIYGRVYSWAAAMDSVGIWSTNGKGCGSGLTCSATFPVRGVCPDGWHIPTKAEFQTLINFVGGTSIGGKNLKSTSGWYNDYSGQDSYLKGNGSNTYGFSALPSFVRYETGGVSGVGVSTSFWSSTEEGRDSVYDMALSSDYSNVSLGRSTKKWGRAVRCIQNSSYSSSSLSNVIASSSSKNSLVDSRDNHTYKIATIGNQIWMAQNLSYETDNSECSSSTGCKYTWGTAMDSAGIWSTNGKGCGDGPTCSPTYPVRGVCPSGWHLPTKNEFEEMFITVGGSNIAGAKLKAKYCWNKNGTDDYGFEAIPEGCANSWIDFWSSTEESAWNVYIMNLGGSRDWADLGPVRNDQGYRNFVRCIKD